MISRQVWETALADRAAGRVYEAEAGQDPKPVDPVLAVATWATWLEHDPDDTKEAREDRRITQIMEAA